MFKKKDIISKNLIDNRYTVENINAVGREVTILLDDDNSYIFKGIFDDYNDLTYNIQYHSYEIDLHIKDMAYFNEML